jgi:hypothetical protein
MIGSLRRECLDHVLVHNEVHLQRVLDEIDAISMRRGHTKASGNSGQ